MGVSRDGFLFRVPLLILRPIFSHGALPRLRTPDRIRRSDVQCAHAAVAIVESNKHREMHFRFSSWMRNRNEIDTAASAANGRNYLRAAAAAFAAMTVDARMRPENDRRHSMRTRSIPRLLFRGMLLDYFYVG